MPGNWTAQPEIGTRFFVLALARSAQWLGRSSARVLLRLVVLFYLLKAGAQRRASRQFLSRVLEREPGWRDVYRHFFYFASTSLDRVFLFSGQIHKFAIDPQNKAVIHKHLASAKGAIVIVSHLGSFEMLRVLGNERGGLPIRILMDRTIEPNANALLESLNPHWRKTVIDTSHSDVDRVLKIKAALARKELVGIMADRSRADERVVVCNFLGKPAPFPVAPWILAGILEVPVVLAFGLYRGGNRYDFECETISHCIKLPRGRRDEAVHEYVQQYADRLGHYARMAPYNWFNFYDFWGSS